MKRNLIRRLGLPLAFLVLAGIPITSWAEPDHWVPRMFYSNNLLTFGEFMEVFENKDLSVKRDAVIYLYGVIDATEKKAWCSFRRVKSSELINFLSEHLRRVDKSRHSERAARVITSVLAKLRPCKG